MNRSTSRQHQPKKTLRSLSLATLTVAALATTQLACTVHAAPRAGVRVVVKQPAPPALRVDVKPARPGHRHVWMAGHYTWRPAKKTYVWTRGQWVKPPRGKTVWVAPRYDGRRSVFVAGYWR